MENNNSLLSNIRSLGVSRLAAIGTVGAAVAAFFVFVIFRLSEVPMALLYADLAPTDSRAIVQRLEAQGISFELQDSGTRIMVPVGEIDRLRLEFASEQLPTGGVVGYELFDSSSALGATSFIQNINSARALQGELARTIQSLDAVRSARVHLVIPERPLFAKDEIPPSASIVLSLSKSLDQSQINGIRHLVSSAVKGLSADKVSIVDGSGQLLASASDAGNVAGISSGQQDYKRSLERGLQQQVEALVASVVGFGNVRAQVFADIDFSQVTETSDIFDPNGQVVRSSQVREKSSDSTESEEGEGTSLAADLPETPEGVGSNVNRQASQDRETDETTNYEISRTRKTLVREIGTIRRLSVAVLVNGRWVPVAAAGATNAANEAAQNAQQGEEAAGEQEPAAPEMEYQPLPAEELQRIDTLVRTAIGISDERGDTLNVINMKFATPQVGETEAGGIFALNTADYLRIAEVVGILIATMIVVFGVLRPLLRKVLEPAQNMLVEGLSPVGNLASGGGASGSGSGEESEPQGSKEPAAIAEDEPVEVQAFNVGGLVDAARQEHLLRDASVQRVGEMVSRHPEAATEIIRGWVAEDKAA